MAAPAVEMLPLRAVTPLPRVAMLLRVVTTPLPRVVTPPLLLMMARPLALAQTPRNHTLHGLLILAACLFSTTLVRMPLLRLEDAVLVALYTTIKR